ncbi:hypothetical protein ABL78_6510 [Leptomonas seymouri]|uniref:Uncharacterized protein n=1 Tax=Leptomonas seymouri TaxID=5684 RepID=A0A0N1IIT4_LEPSE|nr:hypothetical protein ABL78_6510 [Leptomonas seymouri]|eukprot:KPI84428.1 hypothetical protein ABL78_6510 [Leptomonas seymouri]
MPVESQTTKTPPPVFARRHPKPQYLAPGQRLKVASKKPPTKDLQPEQCIPRDPWESQDDARELLCSSDDDAAARSPGSDSPPQPLSAVAGGANNPPHRPRSTGGHRFASHLSRLSNSENRESTPSSDVLGSSHLREKASGPCVRPAFVPPAAAAATAEDPTKEGEGADGDDATERDDDAEGMGEDDYYHTAPEEPNMTAAERAQRVWEMQQEALAVKQLQKLTEQGIARRPKTLVRNRHGRLQAITAQPSATATDPTLRIADAPVVMKAKTRPRARGAKSSKMTTSEPTPNVTAAEPGDSDLVNSRPSTPADVHDEARLEIDLD